MASSSAFDNGGGVEGTKGTYGVVWVDLEPLGLAEAIRSQQAMNSLLTQAAIISLFDVCICISPVWVSSVVGTQSVFGSAGLPDLANPRKGGVYQDVDELTDVSAFLVGSPVRGGPLSCSLRVPGFKLASVVLLPFPGPTLFDVDQWVSPQFFPMS